VSGREYGKALSELPTLLSSPDASAVGLVNALVDQHVLVGVAVEGGSGQLGRTLTEVGKPYLKFKIRTYAQQARRWSGAEIEAALRLLRRADARAKTTAGRDRPVLEELLLALQGLRDRSTR
jgi:DNA polymerase III delta subunit